MRSVIYIIYTYIRLSQTPDGAPFQDPVLNPSNSKSDLASVEDTKETPSSPQEPVCVYGTYYLQTLQKQHTSTPPVLYSSPTIAWPEAGESIWILYMTWSVGQRAELLRHWVGTLAQYCRENNDTRYLNNSLLYHINV